MPADPSFEPDGPAAAAAMLAHAAAERISLVPRGSGTKLRGDSAAASFISTKRLTGGLAHYAGDLVATAPSGCTLREVNETLGRERQWIPLDPPFGDRATIGGIVAANDSGPRRHRFGSPRDLIIGIQVALTSGTVAHSGGRVVKNVAGYDLGRLFCGSLGSLGLITSVTFKLAPIAPASRTVIARFARAADAVAAAIDLAASASLTPSALDVIAPEPRLLVRFDTTLHSAQHMAASAASLLAPRTTDIVIVDHEAEAAIWADHQSRESAGDGLVATVAVLPTATADVCDLVGRLASELGVGWTITGRAALGVLRVHATGEEAGLQRFAAALRAAVAAQNGHAQFVGGAGILGQAIDPRGPIGSAGAVSLAVKQRFDPAGVLPYPWARS
jgi:glycolate dehydrogenase FAD-binding subunit